MQRKQSASERPGTASRHRFLTRRLLATLFPQGVCSENLGYAATVAVYPPGTAGLGFSTTSALVEGCCDTKTEVFALAPKGAKG